MEFSRIKHAVAAALALGGAFVGAAAHADVFTAGTGNGELTLFVRNETTGQVYARGLGANNRIDDIATEAMIIADVTYTPVPQPTPETLPTTYTFGPLAADANLTGFLSQAGVKTYSVMGGDSLPTDPFEENMIGSSRFVSTIPSQFNPTTNPQAANSLMYGSFGPGIDALNSTLNGNLPGAAGSGSSIATGGLYGTPLTDGEFAKDWFGSSVPTTINLGDAAGFYLHTPAGGPQSDPARVYKIGTFTLSAIDGTLSFVSESAQPPAVPLPAAAWLLLSGLAGMGAIGRRRAANAKA